MEKNNNSTFESDFDEDNFANDNRLYGTTREAFDRRNLIDQKNLQETFVRNGITWVSDGKAAFDHFVKSDWRNGQTEAKKTFNIHFPFRTHTENVKSVVMNVVDVA